MFFSSEVSEGKTSTQGLAHALHKKINLTLSNLDKKISDLEKEFAEKRKHAMLALHALHGGSLNSEEEEQREQPTSAQVTTHSAPEARYFHYSAFPFSVMCVASHHVVAVIFQHPSFNVL